MLWHMNSSREHRQKACIRPKAAIPCQHALTIELLKWLIGGDAVALRLREDRHQADEHEANEQEARSQVAGARQTHAAGNEGPNWAVAGGSDGSDGITSSGGRGACGRSRFCCCGTVRG